MRAALWVHHKTLSAVRSRPSTPLERRWTEVRWRRERGCRDGATAAGKEASWCTAYVRLRRIASDDSATIGSRLYPKTLVVCAMDRVVSLIMPRI